MCGIAGIAVQGGGVRAELSEAMAHRLAHRGPDEATGYADGRCALHARRLAVQDVARGHQPAFNEDRTVVAVLNGEIYNFPQLREELRTAGHRPASGSDTEVIPHLYEKYGERFVDHLHGMFAVAVWDVRARRLLLARDRLGKKPLFYTEHGGQLRFASEIKAFFADRDFPREPDLEAVHLFLCLGAVPAPRTGFRHVRALPPAHLLVYEDGKTRTERYWSPYPARRLDVDLPTAGDLVRETLRTAVRRRLRADVPVGAFLSGGVDSAAVVALMAEESSKVVPTFTIGVEGDRDERADARRVARAFGTAHTERVVGAEILGWLPRLVWHYDQPFADSSMLPTYAVAQEARRHVTVALNGDGGDEAFLGYRRTSELARWRQRGGPPPLPPPVSSMGVGALPPDRVEQVRASGEVLDAYATWLFNFDEPWLGAAYQPDLAAAAVRADARELLRERGCAGSDDTGRLQAVDYQLYLADVLLPKVDIATMAVSLEARSPFLDHELVELALSLPTHTKLSADGAKLALRRAFRGIVPDANLDAPKRGFGVPLDAWFRGPLGRPLCGLLTGPHAQIRSYLRPDAINALVEVHLRRHANHGNRLFSLLCLEMWLRTYIAAPPPSTAPTDRALTDFA